MNAKIRQSEAKLEKEDYFKVHLRMITVPPGIAKMTTLFLLKSIVVVTSFQAYGFAAAIL